MKKLKSIVGVMVVMSVTMISSTALATDTVHVGGQTVTCTNRCVVNVLPNGSFTVEDCCGGQISQTFPPTHQQ
ncbi:MAG TPA: hypothetical protein VHW23_45180 [Kofleriaceae bacterium]|jgi:hypothetical protein|nr:hypothetical protein [Kofleriaceae bacterium]